MQKVDTACFEIITRCPLACIHCSACASPRRTDSVTTDQFALALERLGQLQELYLSGGEPFEHPELVQLIALAKRWAERVVLYSSGVVDTNGPSPLSYEIIRKIAQTDGIHRIDVSLHSDNPEDHELITATPGSWAAALESIQRLQEVGMEVGFHHVPIQPRAHVLQGIARLAEQLRIRKLHVLALAPQGRGALLGAPVLSQEWADVAHMLSTGETRVDVILSSRIRQQMGLQHSTERDSKVAIFVDYRGRIYPGEGDRQPAMKSSFSLFDTVSSDPVA